MSINPTFSVNPSSSLPSIYPPEFQTIQVEINGYTGETIEVIIDPKVYKDDWDHPYETDLTKFVFFDDVDSDPVTIRYEAVLRNDPRYDKPEFREKQIERVSKIMHRSREVGIEEYWIHRLCPDELEAHRQRRGIPDLSLLFKYIATFRAIERVRMQEELVTRTTERYKREDTARLANMHPIRRMCTKFDRAYDRTIDTSVLFILDRVGKRGDPEGERRRNIALNCINATATVAAAFFFRFLLESTLKSSH